MSEQGIYLLTIFRGAEADPYYYVGQSNNIGSRLADHMSALRRSDHHNRLLQRCWNKYGDAAFSISVLELVSVAERLTEREWFWFEAYVELHGRRRVLNLCRPSDCPLREPEIRALQREGIRRRDTENTTWRANVRAARQEICQRPEYRSKLSSVTREKFTDPSHREKMAAAWRRRSDNQEWRAKLADAGRANAADPEWRAKVADGMAQDFVFIDPNGNLVTVHNLNQFCREHGLSASNMCNVQKGRRAHHKGWRKP